MLFLIAADLTGGFAVLSLAQAHGQDQTGSSMIGGSYGGSGGMVYSLSGGAPNQLGPAYETPTRYETSLRVLRAQMDYQARRDGGRLTAKHEAEFQRALDDTNRHFHKGPYARP